MSLREFMSEIIRPGETIVMAGKRGGGKTATSVSMLQHAMSGDYGHRNVVCVTNVIFGRVVGGGAPPVEAYPENVFHEDTLSETMRRIGQILREYGEDCTIVWLLDEAQNFMLADLNGSKENMALTKYLGNARKFNVCNLYLTPAINNLTPRVRCFPTGESKSGYCSCQMQKDPARASRIVPAGVDPRCITYVRTSAESPEVPVVIRPTQWVDGVYGKGLRAGSYGYDTKSTATFSVGENENGVPFSFDEFIRATSGGLSHEVPEKIDGFFDKWDSAGGEGGELPGEDYTRIRISEQCRRIQRMRDRGVTWPQIAFYEGEIETTLKSRYKKWTSTSSEKDDARPSTNDEGGPAFGRIYTTLREEEGRAPGLVGGGGET